MAGNELPRVSDGKICNKGGWKFVVVFSNPKQWHRVENCYHKFRPKDFNLDDETREGPTIDDISRVKLQELYLTILLSGIHINEYDYTEIEM